jgi:adenosine deaminase
MTNRVVNRTENTSWFQQVPKVELHLHLEGAIPLDALWELIMKYGGEPSVPNRQALDNKFQYRDFSHFIQTWIWKNQFLREYEDFTLVAEAAAKDLVRQNIRYAEVFYTPSDFFRHALETQKLTESIRIGLSRVAGIEVALVADFCRDSGVPSAVKTLAALREVKELGVVGVTIGGSEQTFPPEPYAEVYEKARQFGFHTSAHAGEAAGPQSIWGAIRSLKVERIGHGTRAFEDERLIEYLADKRIPLEVCPLSNVRTGVIKSIDEHPVRRFFERGLVVTINTDDPKMFGNSMAEEYNLLVERLGFSSDEVRSIILQAIQSSWLSPRQKQQLEASFQADRDWRPKDGQVS